MLQEKVQAFTLISCQFSCNTKRNHPTREKVGDMRSIRESEGIEDELGIKRERKLIIGVA